MTRCAAVQLAMLTSGVVVLTLLINAPLLPSVLHWTGLARISPVKARLRAKAVRSLRRFTEHAIVDLEHDTGEMMRGAPQALVQECPEPKNSNFQSLFLVTPACDALCCTEWCAQCCEALAMRPFQERHQRGDAQCVPLPA